MAELDKKPQIINAAVKVFARQGLERGKIADIAEQAGIGKGTIYGYFRSKDDIFRAIENMFIVDTIEQLRKIAGSAKSPTKKIQEICDISLDLRDQMGDSVLIISELWAQHSRGQLHGHDASVFKEMYDQYYNIVADILNEGIAKKEFRKMSIAGVTTLLLAMIDGVIWQSVIFKDSENFNYRKKEAKKAFINGITL